GAQKEECPQKAPGIDSRMFIIAGVLGGHQGMDQILGQGPKVHPGPVVVQIEFPKGLPIGGNELGRQVGLRVFQPLKGGHLPKGPPRGQQEHQHHAKHAGPEKDPEPFDVFKKVVVLSGFLCSSLSHDQLGTFSISKPRSVMPSSTERPCTSPFLRMACETVTLYTPESGKTIFSRYHSLFSTTLPLPFPNQFPMGSAIRYSRVSFTVFPSGASSSAIKKRLLNG